MIGLERSQTCTLRTLAGNTKIKYKKKRKKKTKNKKKTMKFQRSHISGTMMSAG